MGQITQATIDMIVEYGAQKKHAPLTINEEQQLAFAWTQARINAETVREQQREIARLQGLLAAAGIEYEEKVS